jgi:DNA repair photolyase
MIIERVERKSPALTSPGLACLSSIPTVNITAGCAHGCIYCYTHGYTIYPGENKIVIYRNLPEKIEKELARKKKKPRTVYFSTSSDAFQPVQEVLDITHDVFLILLKNGIGVSFLTKGHIPAKHFQLLAKYSALVSAGVGIISHRDDVLKAFEPYAASAGERLGEMQTLVKTGVFTQARIDPILPGITDSADDMEALISRIAQTGVGRIAASALFLRPSIQASFQKQNDPMVKTILEQFNSGQRLCIHAVESRVLALPEAQRQGIYKMLQDVCSRHGIEMKICACKNPDIAQSTCSIAGKQPGAPPLREEMSLFPKEPSKENNNGEKNPN